MILRSVQRAASTVARTQPRSAHYAACTLMARPHASMGPATPQPSAAAMAPACGARRSITTTHAAAMRGHGRPVVAAAAAGPSEVWTAKEAQELMQSQGYVYLDVRTPEEFAMGHVPGAINVPLATRGFMGMELVPTFVEDVKKSIPDANKPILVACKAGNRSTAAIQFLASSYPCLVNYKGSWDDWSNSGLPVEQ